MVYSFVKIFGLVVGRGLNLGLGLGKFIGSLAQVFWSRLHHWWRSISRKN